MKPPIFDYVAATSVEDALTLLADGRDSRILAGGQSLLPILNLRLGVPELLVDISRIDDLASVELLPGGLRIGAAATQTRVLGHADAKSGWPLLASALEHIGHPQIRNRGTVCGSLAHGDPQAELPAVAVALGAKMLVQSLGGTRQIAADDMFTGSFSTALAPEELLVAVEFPDQPVGWAFQEFAVRPGDFAVGGVACVFDPARSVARVVMFGVSGSPVRATAVEAALLSGATDLEQVAASTVAALDLSGDVHTSASSRRTLLIKLLIDAVRQVQERARTETDT